MTSCVDRIRVGLDTPQIISQITQLVVIEVESVGLLPCETTRSPAHGLGDQEIGRVIWATLCRSPPTPGTQTLRALLSFGCDVRVRRSVRFRPTNVPARRSSILPGRLVHELHLVAVSSIRKPPTERVKKHRALFRIPECSIAPSGPDQIDADDLGAGKLGLDLDTDLPEDCRQAEMSAVSAD